MDILDTGNLQERLDELGDIRDEWNRVKEELNDAERELAEFEEKIKGKSDNEVEELQEELEELTTYRDELEEELAKTEELDIDEEKELEELEALQDEISGWRDGICLISECDFTEYCQEMLDDCGDIPKNLPSYIVIDWEQTVDNLRADYSEVEYQGTTYLWRD
jgi:DNA repair exonuclease SbcCD ATPase subunit